MKRFVVVAWEPLPARVYRNRRSVVFVVCDTFPPTNSSLRPVRHYSLTVVTCPNWVKSRFLSGASRPTGTVSLRIGAFVCALPSTGEPLLMLPECSRTPSLAGTVAGPGLPWWDYWFINILSSSPAQADEANRHPVIVRPVTD